MRTLLLAWLLFSFSNTSYAAITITTPTVNSGELIRASDWNKVRTDLLSLSTAVDILGYQVWNFSGQDLYYLNGKVGIGTDTFPAHFSIHKASPTANEKLFQIGTGADADKANIDEDGDLQIDGTLLVRGGTIYDSNGALELNGEDNVYLSMDWNNDDNDNRALVIGKNAAGPGGNWAELMRVTETGRVGIGTANPSHALQVVGDMKVNGGASDDGLIISNATDSLRIKTYAGAQDTARFSSTGGGGDMMTLNLGNGNIGIGTISPSSGLKLDVEGKIGATEYCDQNGGNCVPAGSLSSGGGSSTWTESGSNVTRASGNVGIGTNTPLEKLHVTSSGQSLPDATTPSPGAIARFQTVNSTNVMDIGVADGGPWLQAYHKEFNATNNARNLLLNPTGGIVLAGTATSPSPFGTKTKLVAGGNVVATGEDIYMGADSGVNSRLGFVKKNGQYPAIAAGSTTDIRLGHWNTEGLAPNIGFGSFSEKVTIKPSGNVGIGTATPSATLDIGSGGLRVREGIINKAGLASGTDLGLYSEGGSNWIRLVSNAGDIRFYVDGAAGNSYYGGTPSMTVAHTGNVGIGIANPTSKLQVAGDLRTNYLRIDSQNTATEGGEMVLMNADPESNRNGRITIDNYDQGLRIFRWRDNPGEYTEYAVFRPNLSYFGMQGNVGIGTSSPTTKLQVGNGGDGYANGLTIRSNYPTIYFRDVDHRSAMIHMNANVMYFLRGCGNDGVGGGNNWCQYNGQWPLSINMENNDATFGGRIFIHNGVQILGDWLRVNGNNGIYFQNYGGGFHMTDSTWLRVYGNKWLYSGAGIRADGGGVRTNQICDTSGGNCVAQSSLGGGGGANTGSTWSTFSDARLKTNVVDLDYGLDTVMAMKPVAFDWIDEAQRAEQVHQVGFLAQEVEALVPELVSTADDEMGTKSLAYGQMAPILVKAIQELKAENDALKARVEALENQ